MDIDRIIWMCIIDVLRLDDERMADEMVLNRILNWLRSDGRMV